MIRRLSFCFKGNRNYVQGPDIVAAVLKQFSTEEVVGLDFKFNEIVSTNLDLIEGGKAEDAKVNVRLTVNGEPKNLQLIENGQPIECRYEFDEGQIIERCNLDIEAQSVELWNPTTYTFCENLVAMNKYLLQNLYPQEKGKWYFTRLEQKYPITDDALITVKLIKNFNFRLTKSDILISNEVVGSVYFTMVREGV